MIEAISLITMAVGVALLFVAGVIWFVTRGLRRVKRDKPFDASWPDGS